MEEKVQVARAVLGLAELLDGEGGEKANQAGEATGNPYSCAASIMRRS